MSPEAKKIAEPKNKALEAMYQAWVKSDEEISWPDFQRRCREEGLQEAGKALLSES